MPIRKLSLVVASLGLAGSLAAQGNCPNGPGAAFGIVAYQCANCGFKQESGHAPSYTFFAEPVVTQVDYRLSALTSNRPVIVIDGVVQNGAIAVGDVIEAIDRRPITTQGGADLFAYPTPGPHSLTVRRGRARQVIDISVPASCGSATSSATGSVTGGTSASASATASTVDSGRRVRIRGWTTRFSYRTDSGRMVFDTLHLRDDGIHRGTESGMGTSSGNNSGSGAISSGGRGYGRGVPAIGGEPIGVGNGASAAGGTGSSPAVGKFGFAVECKPSCTLKRTPSGEFYYKYDGYPRIVEVRERSAADRAGLRVGDLVIKVDGKSILDDDVLHDMERRDQLRITVRRDGQDIDVIMLVVR
jgi:hypothetical protein